MADAPNLERPGADLIAWYLSPARHPADRPWSAKHADTQRRLCERFVAPVIAAITCQDIKVAHMQQAVNAAPTAGEGARLHRCLSAMVTAGITGGYLTNPRLRQVHWQAADRPAPGPQVSMQGEAAQFVDPSEIPAAADVARLGQALAAGRRGDLHELMANTAAYTGLRQGELFALTTGQIDPAARVIDVDRKVIEVSRQAAHRRAQRPQAPQDHLPRPHPAGLPAGRQDRGPHPGRPRRAESRHQPAGADVPLPPRHLVAVLQLRPPRPGPRLPGGRLARPRRQRPLDLAQPAARAVHHRPVHLETRRHRRLRHGRARQRPHHPGHVHRHHRRRPRPRPHSHRITRPATTKGSGQRLTQAAAARTGRWGNLLEVRWTPFADLHMSALGSPRHFGLAVARRAQTADDPARPAHSNSATSLRSPRPGRMGGRAVWQRRRAPY